MTVAGDLLTRNGLRLDAVRQQIAARSTILRPGRPATFIQGLGEDYAQTDEARRLIAQICRDIEALKSHLHEA